MLKKLFDYRSLTLTSALLGVLLILVDATEHFEGIPGNIVAIAKVIVFALTFFGVYNAAQASETDIISKFKEFAKTKFGGSVLVGILTYLSNQIPDDPNAPSGWIVGAKIVGAILTVLLGASGSRELVVKARLNNKPLSPELEGKYEVYKH